MELESTYQNGHSKSLLFHVKTLCILQLSSRTKTGFTGKKCLNTEADSVFLDLRTQFSLVSCWTFKLSLLNLTAEQTIILLRIQKGQDSNLGWREATLRLSVVSTVPPDKRSYTTSN